MDTAEASAYPDLTKVFQSLDNVAIDGQHNTQSTVLMENFILPFNMTWRRARWGAGGSLPRTPLRAPPRVAASFHTFRCGDAQQYDSCVDIRWRVTVAAWTAAREALASRRRGVLCRWRGWRRGVDLGPFATLASSVRGRRGEGAPAAGR